MQLTAAFLLFLTVRPVPAVFAAGTAPVVLAAGPLGRTGTPWPEPQMIRFSGVRAVVPGSWPTRGLAEKL